MNLKDYAIDHPYYCSLDNYYSNDASFTYETMTDFLDYWESADVDMNLVFRWDINEYSKFDEDLKEVPLGKYYAEVFIMLQRKGIFTPCMIESITEEELPRFINI